MIGTLGIALVAVAVAAALLVLLCRGGALETLLRRYAEHLDGEFDRLCAPARGRLLAAVHGLCLAALLVAALATQSLAVAMLLVPAGVAPVMAVSSRRAAKIRKIEEQLPSWLVALSNALKASPSIGEALASSARLAGGPIGQEIDLMLKSVALGTSLQQAMRDADRRVGSSTFSSAMTALNVGRQTGGELPVILVNAAGTLREMERLSGVVRTKTAEAKTQGYALAGIPFLVGAFLQAMDSHWFPQYLETGIGTAMLVVAIGLWAGSILVSRKILSVDI